VRPHRLCRAVIEHAIDLVTFVDASGQILLESPSVESLLGFLPSEREGRSIFELIHVDDLPKARAVFQSTMAAKGRSPLMELRVRHKNGSWRTFESVGGFVEDGGARMGLIHSRDVTARKRLEARLFHEQKLEALGRLTGSIAHDFNNVLMAIFGHTDQMLETYVALPIRLELREIRKAAELGASLTRQLLRFSRPAPLDPERLDVNVAVNDVRELLQRLIGSTAKITITTGARSAHVLAAKGAIEQIVVNLALNARDAIPAGGSIAIRTWNTMFPDLVGSGTAGAQRDYIVIDVADRGSGMSAEVAERLFEPFFTTKEPGKGTGLGLSTVYSIVHDLGGWIDVETTEGLGTTFHVYLPVA
jgi:two-component system cell cycle sensor histidine kinase/response regulator CckA